MESRLDKRNDQVVVALTNNECLRIADGQVISDRNNPFDPMAKVEVRPLIDIDPTYETFDFNSRDSRLTDALARVACRAMILGNNDIVIFVPHELVAYNMYTSETMSAGLIQGDPDVIPKGGLRVEFSGVLE